MGFTTEQRVALHRRALRLEYLTVGWNVIEAAVAIAAGILAHSVARSSGSVSAPPSRSSVRSDCCGGSAKQGHAPWSARKASRRNGPFT
jgi:hypothetical protein